MSAKLSFLCAAYRPQHPAPDRRADAAADGTADDARRMEADDRVTGAHVRRNRGMRRRRPWPAG
jgi:hypothetical protein